MTQTTNYSLRWLANRDYMGIDGPYGEMIQVRSPLEAYGMAMRYAMKPVQYYSPNYDYEAVNRDRNEAAKQGFDDYSRFGI